MIDIETVLCAQPWESATLFVFAYMAVSYAVLSWGFKIKGGK